VANHYVDSSAAGGGDGSIGTPWNTIAQVNAHTFVADDFIYFKCGSLFREQLTIGQSGSSGHPITYASYDTGAKPKIFGSVQLTTWTSDTGHWVCTYSGTIEPVWFINASDGKTKWGNKKASKAACVAEYDWYSNGSSVWCYAATDPDVRYTSVEAGVRTAGVLDPSAKSYVSFIGLEIAYAANHGIRNWNSGTNGWTIDGCTIHHCGIQNGTADGIQNKASNSTIQNNIIYDAGQHGIYILQNNGLTTENVIVKNNTVYNCYHAGIDIMNNSGTSTNIDVLYNLVYTNSDYDDYSFTMQGISVTSSGGSMTDVGVVYNIILNSVACGIYVEYVGVSNCYAYNNTIYFTNPASAQSSPGIKIKSSVTSFTIKNNIVMDMSGPCLSVDDKTKVTACDYNCWYKSAGGTAIYAQIDGSNYHYNDFAAYKTATGWDTNGKWEDPKFTDAPNNDFHLQESSPCRDTGTDLGYTLDYYGDTVPQGVGPDIGASEAATSVINLNTSQAVGLGDSVGFISKKGGYGMWEGIRVKIV
jgi:hypothetical protein